MRRRRSLLTSRSRDPSSSTDGRGTAITASSIATVAIGIHTAAITAIVHFFFLKAKK
jgi:hypothetical protein